MKMFNFYIQTNFSKMIEFKFLKEVFKKFHKFTILQIKLMIHKVWKFHLFNLKTIFNTLIKT